MKRTFQEWIKCYNKPKYYIWTDKQKQDVKKICLVFSEIWLLFKVEAQEISYKKAVNILECKHRLFFLSIP